MVRVEGGGYIGDMYTNRRGSYRNVLHSLGQLLVSSRTERTPDADVRPARQLSPKPLRPDQLKRRAAAAAHTEADRKRRSLTADGDLRRAGRPRFSSPCSSGVSRHQHVFTQPGRARESMTHEKSFCGDAENNDVRLKAAMRPSVPVENGS